MPLRRPIRRLAVVLPVVAAFVAALVAAPAQAQPSPRKPLGKFVVVDAGRGIQYLLPSLAKKLGYFDDEGLQVEIINAGSGTDATAALTSGQADVIQTGLPHIVATNEKGLQLWAIAPAIEAYTLSVVVANEVLEKTGVKPDSTLAAKMKALAAVKAKIAITRPGASTDLFMRYLCLETKVDCEKDLDLIPLGAVGPTAAAFEQRRIVAFVRSHPDVDISAARSRGTILISGPAGHVPSLKGYLYLMFATSDRQIRDRGEHLTAFLRGIGKALKFIQAHPDAARAIALEYTGTGIDRAVFDSAWAQSLPAFPKDLVIDAEGVATTFKVLEKLEGEAPKIDPRKVYRTDLAETATKAISSFVPKAP
jgi:NitT/TauT family transport system substrate-binding protein